MADAHWYVVSGEERFGPLTDEEVRRLLQYEAFGPHALAWKQGEPAWAALAQHFTGPETPTAAARKPTGKFRWLTLPALLLTLVAAAALAQVIQESLAQRHAPKRLDNDALVRRAVSKLL